MVREKKKWCHSFVCTINFLLRGISFRDTFSRHRFGSFLTFPILYVSMCLCVYQTINICWAVFGGHLFSQAPANVTNATTAAAKTPTDTVVERESITQLAKLSGDDDDSSSAGAVVGIAVAVIALLAIVVAGVVYRWRRKARMANGHGTRRGIVSHTNQVSQC